MEDLEPQRKASTRPLPSECSPYAKELEWCRKREEGRDDGISSSTPLDLQLADFCSLSILTLSNYSCYPLLLLSRTDLPVEVIERILKYTFLRRTPLTPSSDLFSLRRTTHLLRVSKSFRLLCLPIFYRSITITRPSHYTTLFGRDQGTFVVGEEGKQRWSFVREISIVVGVEPPIDFEATFSRECDAILPLKILPDHTLDVVCLLERREAAAEEGKASDLLEFMKRLELVPARWDAFRDAIVNDDELSLGYYGLPGSDLWKEEEQFHMREMAKATFEQKRNEFYKLLWLDALETRIPTSVLSDPFLTTDWSDWHLDTSIPTRFLSVYFSKPSSSSVIWNLLLGDLIKLLDLFSFTLRVHLLGFSSSLLSPIQSYVTTGAPLLSTSKRRVVSLRSRVVDLWTWYLPDGNLHSMKPFVSPRSRFFAYILSHS